MVEIWKDVVGFEGLYQVSDLGRVRSLPRNTTKGKILALGVGARGRLLCRFSKEGKFKSMDVATMVARAFIGERNGLFVLHWDDDLANNKATNLRYGTQAENMKDMVRNGHSLKGERHNKAKLTEERVLSMKKDLLSCTDYAGLAVKYGVSKESVQAIKHGRNWGWLKLS